MFWDFQETIQDTTNSSVSSVHGWVHPQWVPVPSTRHIWKDVGVMWETSCHTPTVPVAGMACTTHKNGDVEMVYSWVYHIIWDSEIQLLHLQARNSGKPKCSYLYAYVGVLLQILTVLSTKIGSLSSQVESAKPIVIVVHLHGVNLLKATRRCPPRYKLVYNPIII